MRSLRQTGVGIIECLIVLAITGLLLSVAMPRLDGMVQKHRLIGLGESFRSDFQLARMNALGTGRTVRIAFGSDLGGSCYVVYQGEAGNCTCNSKGQAKCLAPEKLLVHQALPQSRGTQIAANVGVMAIDGQRGTVTPTATIHLSNSHGQTSSHIVAVTGRVRSCGFAKPGCST